MNSWQWAWLTHSEPDAAYGNLERVIEELRERNFNSIRIDTALNWCFHADGSLRGKLPMVVTEGGFFYAPLNSRFEESEAGLDYFDHLTDLAVQHDLWAFVMTTYNGPEVPVWWACPKWLAENNDRFLKGTIKG